MLRLRQREPFKRSDTRTGSRPDGEPATGGSYSGANHCNGMAFAMA